MSDQDEAEVYALYQRTLRVAKAEYDRLNADYQALAKKLTDKKAGIAALEKMVAGAAPPRVSRLMYSSDQFKGMSVPDALAKLMLKNPGWHTQSELTDAIIAGGFDGTSERHLVRGRVKEAFKYWHNKKKYAENDPVTKSWQLTALGRRELADDSSEPPPPSGQLVAALGE